MAWCTLRSPRGALFEPLLLALSTSTALAALVWLTFRLPQPPCLLHRWTGLPCPTCGGTRAALALVRGDIVAAWGWNPLVTVGLLALVVANAYAAVVLLFRLPCLRLDAAVAGAAWWRAAAFGALGLNWAYLIASGR